MYGFDEDTDLSFLIGKEICQVCIGSYDVQLNWGNGGISATGEFRFKPSGCGEEIKWRGDAQEIESAARTVRLLKASIVEVKCTRNILTLLFSNGDKLDLIDDERYESLTISNGKDTLIVV